MSLKLVMQPGTDGQGGAVLVLGLEHVLLERIQKGEALKFDLSDVGWALRKIEKGDAEAAASAGTVIIYGGRDSADLARQAGFDGVSVAPDEEKKIAYDGEIPARLRDRGAPPPRRG